MPALNMSDDQINDPPTVIMAECPYCGSLRVGTGPGIGYISARIDQIVTDSARPAPASGGTDGG
jgi:hypothetical protein